MIDLANSPAKTQREMIRRERLGLWLSAIPFVAFLFHAAVGVYMRWVDDPELIRRWDKAHPEMLLLGPILFVLWIIALHSALTAIRSASRISWRTSTALSMLLVPTYPVWHAWYVFLTTP